MLFALVFAALLPLQSPPTASTTTTAVPAARDVAGVEAEPDDPAPPPPPAPVVDPAALDRHDHDEDAHLVSQPAPQLRRRAAERAAAIARHDDAVRRAMIVGLSGLGTGLLLGGGLAVAALAGPQPWSLAAGFAVPVVIVAAPTTALLLFAHDIDPTTPWFTAGGVFVGGLVGGTVGALALYPLTVLVDDGDDVLYDSPAEVAVLLLPVAGLVLGATGGVLLTTSGAGHHIDIE